MGKEGKGRPKTGRIYAHLRVDPELRKKADREATKQNRTFSNWVESLIIKALKDSKHQESD